MNVPQEAVACPECGHPTRSPAHYIDVGRRKGAAAERDRCRQQIEDADDGRWDGYGATQVLARVLELIGDDT